MTMPMRGLRQEPPGMVFTITDGQRRAAERLVRRQARDGRDAVELLDALGLAPERQQEGDAL